MNRGAALPATLFALAITSAMAVGGVHVARRHKASMLESSAAVTLRSRAEAGAVSAVVQWDSASRASQPVGSTVTVDSSAKCQVWVARTGDFGYLIVAEAHTAGRPVMYHRIGFSVVLVAGRPRVPFPRAWAQLP